jgi:hypothetical protein
MATIWSRGYPLQSDANEETRELERQKRILEPHSKIRAYTSHSSLVEPLEWSDWGRRLSGVRADNFTSDKGRIWSGIH